MTSRSVHPGILPLALSCFALLQGLATGSLALAAESVKGPSTACARAFGGLNELEVAIPALKANGYEFYRSEAPQQLSLFLKWLEETHPELLAQDRRSAPVIQSIVGNPLFFTIPPMKLAFLERLSREEWGRLDEEFMRAMRDRLETARPGLKAITARINQNQARMFEPDKISFNGLDFDHAVFVGQGNEGRVYRVKVGDQPRVIKIFLSQSDQEDAWKAYSALRDANAPAVLAFDRSQTDGKLLLEAVSGLSLKEMQQQTKRGLLPQGLEEAMEILLLRELVAAREKYAALVDQRVGKAGYFNPHLWNWIFDPETARFILIDPH